MTIQCQYHWLLSLRGGRVTPTTRPFKKISTMPTKGQFMTKIHIISNHMARNMPKNIPLPKSAPPRPALLKPIAYFLLSVLLFSPIGSAADTLEISRFPSLISAVRISSPLDFCGEPVPLDEPEVRERMEREMLMSMGRRYQALLWIKRSGRYFPHIEKVLEQNGMPDDLKYIAVAESALLPHIGSVKHAIGFWQFMKPTGQSYGLRIDRAIDERRNIFASTRAATQYLKDLHEDLGSWTLAAAAYNMGQRGLERRISAQKTRNYYHLYIPLETQRYIFRILSVKQILSNPEKYGFYLTKKDLYRAPSFDRVRVEVSDHLPVQLIAQASSTYYKRIKDLNPEIRGDSLPEGSHSILVPKGTGSQFHALLAPLAAKYRSTQIASEQRYTVKKGDTLSGIAKKFGVRVSDLKRWNKKLKGKTHLHPGDTLIIHKKRSAKADPPVTPPFDRVRVEAKGALALQLIAQASSSTVREIKELNPEIRGDSLPEGSHSILVPEGSGEGFHDRLTPLVAKNRPTQAPGDHAPSERYIVKQGDTLLGIAKKFGVQVSDLWRWNKGLEDETHLHPGDELVIHQEGVIHQGESAKKTPPARGSFDWVRIEVSEYLPLQLIAQASSSAVREIKDLNPGIHEEGLFEGSHSIKVPKGTGSRFHANLAPLAADYQPTQIPERAPPPEPGETHRHYIVRKGDTLSSIAEKFGVPMPSLEQWNKGLDQQTRLYPGDRLVIHEEQ
ncbi:MAG: Soluble lytic murein transglycosylase [Candidatus Kentron sp. G]|nr:MAG: Soluble lytic murein transglycosylase [Candidatus Kentron sp. G]VFM98985.1 MAG: Soluble lytic murein transglycosylase [Candidatus Kentron sp. G]